MNSYKGEEIGGNVFFLNRHGVLVGETGEINVGTLSLLTPTKDFMDNFFTGGLSGEAVEAVLAGNIPISASGLVTVKGKIDARSRDNDGLSLRINAGKVQIGRAFADSTAGSPVDFGDIVNINGLESNPEITVTADGKIVIQAKSSIDITEGSKVSAGGDLELKVEQAQDQDKLDLDDEDAVQKGVQSEAAINIKGATLEGKNISLLTSAAATFEWEPSSLLGLPMGALPSGIDDDLTGEEAGLGVVNATAGINIGAGSILTASGQVKLEAAANSVLKWNSETNIGEGVSVGLLHTKLKADSAVTVASGARITGGSLDISARNDSLLEVKSLAHTDNKDSIGQVALLISQADINSLARVDSGAVINVRDLNISAVNQNSFFTQASAATSAGYAGVAVNIFTVDSKAEAINAADLTGIDNLIIEALDLTTKNQTVAETKLVSPGFVAKFKRQAGAKVQDFIGKKLDQQQEKQDGKTGAAVKPRLAGALTIVNTDHQAIAAIAENTTVKAKEDIVLSSRVIAGGIDNKALTKVASKAKDKAKPEDPAASLSLSAAVIYGDYNHTATAFTGDNTNLEAKRVGLNAQTIQPYEFTWHKYEGIESIIDKLKNVTGDLGLSSQLTGYANAAGKADDLSIAGSASLLSFANNITAYTGKNSIINILGVAGSQEWKPVLPGQTRVDKWLDELNKKDDEDDNGKSDRYADWSLRVTLESPVTIKAVTEIGGAFAAGNIGGLTNPAGVGAQPDGGSVGGAYSHPVYYNTTNAYVAEGTVIKPAAGVSPVDLSVIAKSREQIISVAPTAGLGSGYGLNGMVALTGVYSTTTASIDDEAQVTAGKLTVRAEDDVLAWALGGAFQ